MTPEGAIICRLAGASRAGEEIKTASRLAELSVPILFTVHGHGTFEGPDLLFFGPRRAFVANSIRSNAEGVKQIAECLRFQQIEVVAVETTFGCGHLDGVVSLVDKDLAIIYPKHASYKLYETLGGADYEIIQLPDEQEARNGMPINMVALGPRRVLIPMGNPRTIDMLGRHGVDCIEVDLSEIMKAGGAVHCVTGILRREPRST